jgi:bacterioferritin-associated ferredoxin
MQKFGEEAGDPLAPRACDTPPCGPTVAERLTIVRSSLQIARMIICVCRGLNTTKVNDAISAGARSPRAVHAHHQTTINCGKCCETVCGMIRDQSGENACQPEMLVAAE